MFKEMINKGCVGWNMQCFLCNSLYTVGWIESNFTPSLSDMISFKVLVTRSRLNGDVYYISKSLQDMMYWWPAQEISFCISWTTQQQQRKTLLLSWSDNSQNVSVGADKETYRLLPIIFDVLDIYVELINGSVTHP